MIIQHTPEQHPEYYFEDGTVTFLPAEEVGNTNSGSEGRYPGDNNRQEFLISVLKLSTFFKTPSGTEYAVSELSRLTLFDPALQLQLGHQYYVNHWVEPAFHILMSWPLVAISMIDAG
ncbi:hypothetical protein BDN67DRAFT_984911 [Paxillus ammoniavirescens]|nr:hypothetical protein BDN67DRAFT_984911 [Paxillus ammoniavirescens]